MRVVRRKTCQLGPFESPSPSAVSKNEVKLKEVKLVCHPGEALRAAATQHDLPKELFAIYNHYFSNYQKLQLKFAGVSMSTLAIISQIKILSREIYKRLLLFV